MTIAAGGKAVYGVSIGILMLQANFPRIPGDMGNAMTWPFPVHYKVVRGASPDRVVRQRAEGLLPDFLAAADEMIADGVSGITTNCGFLSLYQKQLAAHCKIPVATSSLMQAPLIQALLPADKRVGIITIDAASLTPEHLEAAHVPLDTPFVGTDPAGEFHRVILNDEPELNIDLAHQDLLNAARSLVEQHPEVGAILLECTNMCPYSRAINALTGLPVFDIYSFITWFHNSLAPNNHLAAAGR